MFDFDLITIIRTMNPGTLVSLITIFILIGRGWVTLINLRARQAELAAQQQLRIEEALKTAGEKAERELNERIHSLRNKMMVYETKLALAEKTEQTNREVREAKEEGYAVERRMLLENNQMMKHLMESREREIEELRQSENALRRRLSEIEFEFELRHRTGVNAGRKDEHGPE